MTSGSTIALSPWSGRPQPTAHDDDSRDRMHDFMHASDELLELLTCRR